MIIYDYFCSTISVIAHGIVVYMTTSARTAIEFTAGIFALQTVGHVSDFPDSKTLLKSEIEMT